MRLNISLSIKMILMLYIISINAFKTEVTTGKMALILIYVISSFTEEIVQRKYRILPAAAALVSSSLICYFYIEEAALLSCAVLLDFLLKRSPKKILSIMAGFIPLIFILNSRSIITLIFIYILIALALTAEIRKDNMIKGLEDDIENKRKLIYELQDDLKEEEELREQLLYTTKLEERNKIAGNLHDKIGHIISASLLQLEAVNIIIDKDRLRAKENISIVIRLLRNGMDDIRKTLRSIKPQEEELGINKIKSILEEKTNNTNYNVKVSYNGELEMISPSVWMIFIQAVKEFSTNSLKYAEGSAIEVRIDVLKSIIKLEVKDDGIGFYTLNKGMGITNIERRVSEINGKLIISGENGFSAIILIPYK